MDRIEGPTTSAAVIRRFQNAITRTEANMSRMRQEREIRERRAQEQDLRREQERAYDESLRIDREREKRMVRERQEAVMRERARLLEEKNRKLYIRYLCQKLKDTLDSDEKTIRISFRMADGSRVIRKFNGSDTLEVGICKLQDPLIKIYFCRHYINLLRPILIWKHVKMDRQ